MGNTSTFRTLPNVQADWHFTVQGAGAFNARKLLLAMIAM